MADKGSGKKSDLKGDDRPKRAVIPAPPPPPPPSPNFAPPPPPPMPLMLSPNQRYIYLGAKHRKVAPDPKTLFDANAFLLELASKAPISEDAPDGTLTLHFNLSSPSSNSKSEPDSDELLYPEPAVEQLTKQLEATSFHPPELSEAEKAYLLARAEYALGRFHTAEPNERTRIEHRLKVPSYVPEAEKAACAKAKKLKLQVEFEKEYDVLIAPSSERARILSNALHPKFTPSTTKLTPEKFNEERDEFIKTNREAVLVDAAQGKMREVLAGKPEDLETFEDELLWQHLIEQPNGNTQLASLLPKASLSDVRMAMINAAKPVINQLNKERKILGYQRNPVPIMEVEDPERRKALLTQYHTTVGTERAKLRQGIYGPEQAYLPLDPKTKKPFRRLSS